MPDLVQSDDELRAIVSGYVSDVLEGRRVVGKLERLCVERHVADLAAVKNGEREGLRFDEEQALRPLQFAVRFVRHTKGSDWAGQRYRFCSGSAWIAFIFWCLLGWQKQREDGSWERRFDEAYVCTARKQGKTMIAAILALLFYFGLGESGAEVYFAATKTEQAAVGWKQAAACIAKEPALNKRVAVSRARYTVTKRDDFEATLKALSRNDHEADGFGPFLNVIDEYHAHPDSGQYDVLTSGTGHRRGPLTFIITTRGANPESACGQHEKGMISILEGTGEDDSTFAYIATLDEGDDYADERVWPKANPNLGVSVSVDSIRKSLQKAEIDPVKLPEWKRKRANLWTIGVKGWLELKKWDACKDEMPELADLAGETCVAAVDLSKSSDFTAGVLAFPRPNGQILIYPRFWLPESVIESGERARLARVPLERWVAAGLVTPTPGELVDQDYVREWVKSARKLHRLKEATFDPAQSWKLVAELQNEGMGKAVTHFPQGWARMHAAVVQTEDAVIQGKLVHDGSPVLRWMFRNVVIRENATGLRRLDKAKSPDAIDGMVALVMAVDRCAGLLAKGQSVYATRGVRTL